MKLEKADAEINVALIPVELIKEARNNPDDPESTGIKILTASVVDDNGEPVFNTESFELLPLAVQKEISEAVHEYNGLGNKEPEKN